MPAYYIGIWLQPSSSPSHGDSRDIGNETSDPSNQQSSYLNSVTSFFSTFGAAENPQPSEYSSSEPRSVRLCQVEDPSKLKFLERKPVREGTQFVCATTSARLKKARHQVLLGPYVLHLYCRPEGICTAILTDHEYDSLIAQHTLSIVSAEFLKLHPVSEFKNQRETDPELSFPGLQRYLEEAQHPENNNLSKIQTELDETKVVLHKTIESVLDRGERIDNLVQKSDDLSAQSKMFFQQAKSKNSNCCIVM